MDRGSASVHPSAHEARRRVLIQRYSCDFPRTRRTDHHQFSTRLCELATTQIQTRRVSARSDARRASSSDGRSPKRILSASRYRPSSGMRAALRTRSTETAEERAHGSACVAPASALQTMVAARGIPPRRACSSRPTARRAAGGVRSQRSARRTQGARLTRPFVVALTPRRSRVPSF